MRHVVAPAAASAVPSVRRSAARRDETSSDDGGDSASDTGVAGSSVGGDAPDHMSGRGSRRSIVTGTDRRSARGHGRGATADHERGRIVEPRARDRRASRQLGHRRIVDAHDAGEPIQLTVDRAVPKPGDAREVFDHGRVPITQPLLVAVTRPNRPHAFEIADAPGQRRRRGQIDRERTQVCRLQHDVFVGVDTVDRRLVRAEHRRRQRGEQRQLLVLDGFQPFVLIPGQSPRDLMP